MNRYTRTFAVVTITQIDDDTYVVNDGETVYKINKETFEKEYEPLL